MRSVCLIVYMINVLLNMHVIGYTCGFYEMNYLYMQRYLLLHYDDIGSIELYDVLGCAQRLNGL